MRPGLELVVLDKAAAAARRGERCRLLTACPGAGAVTALTYAGTVEDSTLFQSARAAGAWVGLTPSRCQPGGTDVSGRISRCGGSLLRTCLCEAADTALTRSRPDSALKRWGLELKARTGHKKAVVAAARKSAATLHAVRAKGEAFRAEPTPAEAAAWRRGGEITNSARPGGRGVPAGTWSGPPRCRRCGEQSARNASWGSPPDIIVRRRRPPRPRRQP